MSRLGKEDKIMRLDLENLVKPKEAGKGKVVCKCHKTASSTKAPLFHCCTIIFVACSGSIVSDDPVLRLNVKFIHGFQGFLQGPFECS